MIPSATSAFHFYHNKQTYYLPFYISPQYLPISIRSIYSIWLYIELFGHVLTLLSIFLFSCVVWKANAFHINMKILNTYAALVLGGTNVLTRLFFKSIELGWISVSDFIIPVHFVKFGVWLGIYHYVMYATAERYAALRFASDYENVRRIWIPLSLIFANTIVSVAIALLLIYGIANGAFYSAGVCASTAISCWIFFRIKWRNLMAQHKLITFANIRQYSVSYRWQLRENIRLEKVHRIKLSLDFLKQLLGGHSLLCVWLCRDDPVLPADVLRSSTHFRYAPIAEK
ncbi:hypothetical protein PMAYCL1PPCAC_15296 [Pristionchus mayeri]|uniref:G protein-coupled receptor n=1 Tax=Pristionchus mayeri TaxID=1317129 RepID=A0AAN5CIP3_9BILA|nr:hypothetical protein PMAYCL1PPCAC_15296 [Pristionchus mayeri]